MSKLELTYPDKALLHSSMEKICDTPGIKGLIFMCVGVVEDGAYSSVCVNCPGHADGEVALIMNAVLAEARKHGVSREEYITKAREAKDGNA